MNISKLCIANNIFDVKGDLTIGSSKMEFGPDSYFWPVGYLVFKLIGQDYPIDKIKIYPCNSTKPIQVLGYIDLQASPQINLEFINAAKVTAKFKNQ